MSRRLVLSLALWMTGMGAAEEPVLVRFHILPENFQVYRIATSVGDMQSGSKKPVDQKLPLESLTEGYVIPREALRTDQFELVFAAPEYQEEHHTFRKFDFHPGLNDWPPPGEPPLHLRPASTASAIRSFARQYRWVAAMIVVAITSSLVLVATLLIRAALRRRVELRIRSLGGVPDERKIGPYIPLGVLGAGGYGVVVKAVHESALFSQQPSLVALKTMLHTELDEVVPVQDAETARSAETRRQRFEREAQHLERLQHDHIVRLVDYSLSSQPAYIAMEYVRGKTFRKVIEENPRGLPVSEALKLIAPVCEALHYAHSQQPPVIHRDIKPENLMITDEGIVKVLDLGLAHSLGDRRLTVTAEWTGTVQYAPAEYLQGVVQPALDQYSVGLVLFELLVGHAANAQGDPERAVHAVLLNQVGRLSDERPELGDFARAVDRMSASDYTRRFGSLKEAMDELKRTAPQK